MLLFGLLRYLVLPYFDNSINTSAFTFWADVCEKLLYSLLTSLVLGLFVYFFLPPVDKAAEIEVIQQHQIGKDLTKAMVETDLWMYRGGTGKYFRSTTLPHISSNAQTKGRIRTIRAQIIDPEDNSVCSAYATYRNNTDGSKLSVKQVRIELLATILATCVFKEQSPLLKIELVLMKTWSFFRVDLSDSYVILTKEKREDPAIRADAGSFFYSAFKDDLEVTFIQGRQVSLLPISRNDLNEQTARDTLSAMNFDITGFAPKDMEDIVKKATRSENPYA